MLLSLNNLIMLKFLMVKLSYASSLSQSFVPTTAKTSSSGVRENLTATPTLSCYPQFQDPDQGILSGFCICNETVSLPQLMLTTFELFNDERKSCAYETSPVSNAISIVLSLLH